MRTGLISSQGATPGLAGPVAGVHNEVFFVGGGSNFPDSMPWLGGKKKYYDLLYYYKISRKGLLTCFNTSRLPFNLAYSANCSTSRGIIIAGGENQKGLVNKVLLLRWSKTSDSAVITALPELPFAVTNAAVVEHKGFIYLAGGEVKNAVSNKMLLLDMNALDAGWKILAPLPKPVSHAVMVVQSNGIYILGGRKRNQGSTSDLYTSTLRFDLKTHQWTEKQPVPLHLSAGTGITAGRHFIMLFGGDGGETFQKTEELIGAIDKEHDEFEKGKLNEEKKRVQSLHPGFCKQVLRYNVQKDNWEVAGYIPYDAPVTTTAVKWKGMVIIPGGEIRAGVRTNQIIAAKIIK